MVDPTQPQKVLLKLQGVIDIQLGMSLAPTVDIWCHLETVV